jgi:cytoskeletal protein CcmA (bactofilin family)
MFGARKGGVEGEPGQDSLGRSESPRSESLSVSAPRLEANVVPPRSAVPARSLSPDRISDLPGTRVSRRTTTTTAIDHDSRTGGDGGRTLKVGKGLSVAGEITSCDILVVEGKVEAKLNDGKMLEITESGQFRGSVEIENADIAGRYDGQIVVHGRLTIRSTGRVSGMVKYGELEVNAGGQIIGELQVAGVAAASASSSGLKGTGKLGTYEEAEEEPAERSSTTRGSSERRSA